MDEDIKELTELYRQLSPSGQQAALFHTNTVLRVENAIRQQYGLLPESISAQTAGGNLPLKADTKKGGLACPSPKEFYELENRRRVP